MRILTLAMGTASSTYDTPSIVFTIPENKNLPIAKGKQPLQNKPNKHSDACIYLPPYKLDVLKIVEYKFSCEMEAHVEVTTSLMFDCNTFKDKKHLLTLVAITLPSKELQFCNFIMQ